MLDLYAVIGHPIKHSLSPTIHRQFATQTKQSLEYIALNVEPGQLQQTIREFVARGGRGLNVTLPFKTDVLPLAKEISPAAEVARAANTLVIDANTIVLADNTDGYGLIADLQHLGLELAGQRLLVVGAGGACRGILGALLEAQAHVTISNRTLARAQSIAEDFSAYGQIEVLPYNQLTHYKPDAIINATSASLSDELPSIPEQLLAGLSWGYDLAYRDIANNETIFTRWLTSNGVSRAYDGLGMLVQQAAASFSLWRNVKPDAQKVLQALRKA